MIYEERQAPPGLESAIARLWYLEVARERQYEKILPQPALHLIVNLSEPYTMFDRSGVATTVEDAFVSGIQSEYLVIASPPVIRQVVVEVRPGGLGAISALPGTELAGRVRPAGEVVADIDALVGGLRAAATPAEALERAASALMRSGTGWRPDPVVEATLAALEADDDRSIGELAAGLPISHRTLIARFRRATGLTPRDYAQLWRFHRFVTGLALLPGPTDWAGLAPLGGYYDQAHVVRAFHRYSGWTPTDYRRRVAEFGPSAASFVPLDAIPSGA
jgi:AraC-like DNA-binding protein